MVRTVLPLLDLEVGGGSRDVVLGKRSRRSWISTSSIRYCGICYSTVLTSDSYEGPSTPRSGDISQDAASTKTPDTSSKNMSYLYNPSMLIVFDRISEPRRV